MLQYICAVLTFSFVYSQIISKSSQINSPHNTRWENGVKVIKLTCLNLETSAVQNQAQTALLKNNHQNDLLQISTQSQIKPLSSDDINVFKQNSQTLYQDREVNKYKNSQLSKVALQCKTVYLPNLDACIPFQCPQKYEWNQQLRQCRLPNPQCKQNFHWNGAVCLPSAVLSIHQIQKVSQWSQKNKYVCPNGLSKCQKKVCPKEFIWIENSCIPKNSQQKCPTSNLINGICQPSYSVEITIKPTCKQGINERNTSDCIPIQPIYKSIEQKPIYLIPNQFKIGQQKQFVPKTKSFPPYPNPQSNKVLNTLPLINQQLPTSFFATSDYLNQYFIRSSNLFTPKIQNKIPSYDSTQISTNKIQQIDLRVPGVVTPKIIIPPAPSFVPQAQPRYII